MSKALNRVQAVGLLCVGLTLSLSAFAQQISPATSTTSTMSNGLLKSETRLDTSSKTSQHPDRLIVRFRNGPPAFLPGSGRALELSRDRNTHLVINPPGLSVRDAIARYRQNPNVTYAEPDFIVEAIADMTPNDPSYPQQWDMTKISAPTVWGAPPPNTSNLVVAVIDTGIDFNHPDLAANIYENAGVKGYTCIGGACVPGGADDHGHGTHVAGTIGAVGHNGIGVAGLNWNIKLLAIKFLNASGSGSLSDAIFGFDKLRELKASGVAIRLTNNSWGGGGYSQALKDAMDAVERAGILNICAAGNSGANADTSPMYPAAYDNRGIVSVLASDATDNAASFSNYGVASVDIAAPGVNIFSTVPANTCSLCDATGYKSLNGTSMASPHVAGVAAAMIAANPALTPYEARDALLDPASYDVPISANARRTSSGGRLNFAKTLANAGQFVGREANNKLNKFPSVFVGPDVFATPGATVTFTQTSTDADSADLANLRTSVGRGPVSSWTAWLMGWRANQLFPASAPFTAPSVARLATMPYDTSVSDNRGGGASGRNWAVISPLATPGSAPSVSLTVPPTGTVGIAIPITVSATPGAAWDINSSSTGGSSGACCYSGTSLSMTFNAAGVYRITSQAIDAGLKTSPMDGSASANLASKLIAISAVGGTTPTGNPPIAAIKLNKKEGSVPLTINVDASASSDVDGTISKYYYDCGVGYAAGISSSTSTCTFSQPGTYWVRVLVTDNVNMMGIASDYVVVTPAVASTDTTAPTVRIDAPISGSTLVLPSTIQVTASDIGSGLSRVDCLVVEHSTACGSLQGSGPYSFQFDPKSLPTFGLKTIRITATDQAGNSSFASATVTTKALIVPEINLSTGTTILSAGQRLSLQRNKARTFTSALSNTPTFGLSKVVYRINNVIVPNDTGNPLAYTFKAATAGTFTLSATPHDDIAGQTGKTISVTLQVK